MNRTRTNDRSARTRNGSADSGRGGSRFGSPAPRRSGGPAVPAVTAAGPPRCRVSSRCRRRSPPRCPPSRPSPISTCPRSCWPRSAAQGVTVPFPIQAATLPNSLAGRDVLGRGRTGSGKTLAFGLALLARTAGQRAEPRQPLALVLVPTRELAQQVTDALTPYARSRAGCGWPPSSAGCRSAGRPARCAAAPRSSSRPRAGSRTSSTAATAG